MQQAIDLLTHAQSAKRRSAARQLKKSKAPEAGPALLRALQREVQDARTWETQCEMVLAIAECGFRDALPFLQQLAATPREATAVDITLGYALIVLGRTSQHDAKPISDALDSGHPQRIEGAFQAMAMGRMVPEEKTISRVLDYARPLDRESAKRYAVVAAAGWTAPQVKSFLNECLSSNWNLIAEAAELALAGKYDKLSL